MCRYKHVFVATKVCLDKQRFVVATNIILSQQIFCHDKHIFVAANDVFCRDKHVLSQLNFVATKQILVAAPANDT